MPDIQLTNQPAPSSPSEFKSRKRVWLGAGIVVLALVSALVTFLILAGMTPISPTHEVVVWSLLGNVFLVLVLIGIVITEARGLIKARREGKAAARLHVRIVALLSLVATLPAILVAIVASVTLERGLDPWFTGAIRSLMLNTVDIAQSYRDTQCRTLGREANLMAADLNRAKVIFDVDRKVFKEFMTARAAFLGFPVAMIVEPNGAVVERVDLKPIDQMPTPQMTDFRDVNELEPICLIPKEGNLFRAIIKLSSHQGRILYVARPVDPRAVEFLPAAEAGVAYYQALDQKKIGIQIAFASMFALISLIVLLSAVWFGLSFANRFVAPIRRLIYATDQVATGNFYVQVPVRTHEGDLAHLSETFNKMTSELRQQHDSLSLASHQIDQRRRFTEAVLSGVSAGVIGVNGDGQITLLNPSAEKLLGFESDAVTGEMIEHIMPELKPHLDEFKHGRIRLLQKPLELERDGLERTLNLRIASEQASSSGKGYVITLDDITDLVSAQRTSAWADVARRIAHEIKNPLTPIQLSAERIRRKYGKVITQDRDVFDQCTDTIIRQVDDIKRMVDEFSSFARMPKPVIQEGDLAGCLRQVLFLMRVGHPEIEFIDATADEKVLVPFDRRQMSQALTNIIKNATEGIVARLDGPKDGGKITSRVHDDGHNVFVEILDNGKGFPADNRQKLLEPYVTSREGGTGLGLAIVAKIFEDHGGGMTLSDNPHEQGARVFMWLPKTTTDVPENKAQDLKLSERAV